MSAVLASCEKGEGGQRGEEKGVDSVLRWLKGSWEERESRLG